MGLYLKISIVFLVCISIVISILLYYLFHKKRFIVFCLIVLVGFLFIKIIDDDYANLYRLFDSAKEYDIEAVIVSDVTEEEYKKVYEIEIKTINGNTKYTGKRWLLNIKKSRNNDLSVGSDLKFGDFIAFYGTIELPSTARNYMGFDYQRYLKSTKLYGTITTKNQVKVINQNQSGFLEKIWYNEKSDIEEKIYQLLPDDCRELCLGILVGERKDISEKISINFRKSNLTHMLAVSGAHVSYIILGLTALLYRTRYRFRKMLMIVFLLFFMGLTGFTPSVQRASLMAILILVAGLVHRKQDIYTSLSFSALIILLCNPYAVLDIGLQLSYAATFGIVLFCEKISRWIYRKLKLNHECDDIIVNVESIVYRKRKKQEIKVKKINLFQRLLEYIVGTIAVTVSANLMIIPFMAFQFNTISLTFWISNLLAGPLLGAIILLGFILYFISLLSMTIASVIAIPLKYLLYLLMMIAEFCSQIPFSSVMIRTPFLFEIMVYYFAIFAVCYFQNFNKKIKAAIDILKRSFLENITGKDKNIRKRKKFVKMVSVVLIFVIVFGNSIGIIENYHSLKIYFVDVGQGDCTLICTPSHQTILIDGGGSEIGSFNVGEKTLLPYLLDRKITKIDYMMISHFDTDHVGGLLYLLEHIQVKHVIISKQGELCENYQNFKNLVLEKNISIMLVKQGDRLQIDRTISFDILFPEDDFISENVLNNNSIVAKLNYADFSMLFTGDIEELAERKLVEKYKDTDVLKATVLKVAHHGSKSSSIQEFLDLICPQISLIGVGEKNTFGHPNEEVLERFEKLHAKIYRTDLCGEIEIRINKNSKIAIKTAL